MGEERGNKSHNNYCTGGLSVGVNGPKPGCLPPPLTSFTALGSGRSVVMVMEVIWHVTLEVIFLVPQQMLQSKNTTQRNRD